MKSSSEVWDLDYRTVFTEMGPAARKGLEGPRMTFVAMSSI